jgi:hypothetical protein
VAAQDPAKGRRFASNIMRQQLTGERPGEKPVATFLVAH